ncbi:hypothetical protein KCP70_24330 [Salmonella enterica subsp. enterica]|nr:hypothetical protein KCP70_24330 [Salmonella enterica subsp. enterica]
MGMVFPSSRILWHKPFRPGGNYLPLASAGVFPQRAHDAVGNGIAYDVDAVRRNIIGAVILADRIPSRRLAARRYRSD